MTSACTTDNTDNSQIELYACLADVDGMGVPVFYLATTAAESSVLHLR